MGRGSVGTEMNVMIRTPKRKKVAADCGKCQYKSGSVCELGRDLNPKKCKWYSTNRDYKISNERRSEIRQSNKVSKAELHKRATYNSGFGDMVVEKADLSKYKKFK